MRKLVALALYRLTCIFITGATAACAAPNPDFYYQFDFRNHEDGQTALVLDYRVESHGRILAHATPFYSPFINGGLWINGPRPTLVYVQWKEGNARFEKNVDLTEILANENIDSKTLFLMFRQQHLFVYLMSNEPMQAGDPRIGPSGAGYGSRKLIYSN